MVETSRRWLAAPIALQVAYVLAALGLLAASLMPLEIAPRPWAAPDLLAALTVAWVVRRPDSLPVTTIAAIWLLADFLMQRPPGLQTALVLVLTEWVRRRATPLRRGGLFAEWGAVALALAALAAAGRVALAVLAIPQPPLGLVLIQLLLTVTVYPAVALVAQAVFRLGARPEADAGRPGLR